MLISRPRPVTLTSSMMRLPRPSSASKGPGLCPGLDHAILPNPLEKQNNAECASYTGGLGVPSSNLGAPTNNPRHLAFFISKVLPEKSDGEDMEALGFHI